MELQERAYSCGPAAIRSALYVLGHTVREATIRRWARTTPQDGTDEKGVMRAVHHYNHKTKEYQSESSRKSWQWLKYTLGEGKPVLLCVDSWNHWVAAIGTLGGQVMIFDPDKDPKAKRRYSGIRLYNQQDLTYRWGCLDEDGKTYYYGISIYP